MLTLVYGRFTGGGLEDELKRRAKLEKRRKRFTRFSCLKQIVEKNPFCVKVRKEIIIK